MSSSILEVKKLKKYFKRGKIKALDEVSFNLYEKEVLGIVGESGSGKSTLLRSIDALYERAEGEVIFKGLDLLKANRKTQKEARKEMQMIFQDPYTSLDERMKVKDIIAEPIKLYYRKKLTKSEIEKSVDDLLLKVGLSIDIKDSYPSHLSGGERQRVSIARAISLKPKVLLADEAVSALDASTKIEILNLIKELKDEFGLSIIFISHDLRVIEYIADRVLVMYKGKIVEEMRAEDLRKAEHPYTKVLLAKEEKATLDETPSLCPYYGYCAHRSETCLNEVERIEIESGHYLYCTLKKG